MADMNALIRSPLVVGAGAVVVIGAAVAGGYFLGSKKPGGANASPAAMAAADRSVCEATLARAQAYGIFDTTAQVTSKDASTTDVKNRMTCSAQSGETTYTITVDVPCNDMGDPRCLKLYKITDSSGATLFRRTKFLDPQ
jgi:hypothetical protein